MEQARAAGFQPAPARAGCAQAITHLVMILKAGRGFWVLQIHAEEAPFCNSSSSLMKIGP